MVLHQGIGDLGETIRVNIITNWNPKKIYVKEASEASKGEKYSRADKMGRSMIQE
jgi:hypothetical protein